MSILIVAATDLEVAPFAKELGEASKIHPRMKAYKYRQRHVHLLVSSIGMIATAAWCSQILSTNSYDLAINLGVCGSFDSSLKPGQVLHVTSDQIADLGAEAGRSFLTVQELKLLEEDEFPFKGGRLVNFAPPVSSTLASLPQVNGITVNTVHGNTRSIAAVIERFQPQVESMEGAAFMYACLIHQVPFAQVRAVSNYVENRNRDSWDLAGAIRNLAEIALRIVEEV